MSLCFRCEHRARFLDAKANKDTHCPRPRHECGDIETSKCACYMFTPCFPVVTEPNPSDTRPRLSSPMLSSREYAVRVMEREELTGTIIYQNENQIALGWRVNED